MTKVKNIIFNNFYIETRKNIFFIVFFLWVLFHIITLQRSPLVWFDEAFFASITKSFQENGNFYLRMATLDDFEKNEVLWYGPIYFYIQNLITKLLGWGIWQFRLLNLMSGIILLYIIIKISKKLNFNNNALIILLLLLVTDNEINSNIHSSRMDSFTMLLFTSAIYIFYFLEKKSFYNIFFTGVLLASAFLSTPRVGFLFLIFPITFLFELIDAIKNKKRYITIIINYIIIFLIIIIPFYIWVLLKFGNISNYIDMFLNNKTYQGLYKLFNLPAIFQMPTLLLWVIMLIYLVFNKYISIFKTNYIVLFSIPILYILFIKGAYSVYFMPFLYLGLIFSYSKVLPSLKIKIYLKYFLFCIIIFNSLIFITKSIFIINSWEARNPENFESYFIKKNLTNENIIASFPYFYTIEKNNRFISNDENRSINFDKLKKMSIKHAFVTRKQYEKDINFFKEFKFQVVEFYIFENKNKLLFINKILKKLPVDISNETSGVYLKRE
jgi:4-amino-4-deoxy-L-arabinose transferase-like glycosyltransferase